ncbi:MAG: YHS domain protein [Bacteroidetes bacterium]|nr:YHS domain protein [Bacteroidota bacterium]
MKKLLFICLMFTALLAHAQDGALRKKNFNLTDGIAIKGWDPIAYFANKPEKGSPRFALFYDGVTYYFSSDANRELFKKSPSRYEPQYGGWCAYAMGKDGTKVEVDPETFKIINGKLFLFYNQFFNNTLKSWNKDETNLHQHADANWQKLYH